MIFLLKNNLEQINKILNKLINEIDLICDYLFIVVCLCIILIRMRKSKVFLYIDFRIIQILA